MKNLLVRNLSVALLFCLPWLTSCKSSNEPGTPFHKGQEVTLSASPLSFGDARRLHAYNEVGEGKDTKLTNLRWDAGDQVDVFVKDGEGNYAKSVFTLISGANTSTGRFKGVMPADGTEFIVFYPHQESTIVIEDGEGLRVSQFNIPENQTYQAPHDGWPTFAKGLMPMIGHGTNIEEDFSFELCAGTLRAKFFSSTGATYEKIRFSAMGDVILTGGFRIINLLRSATPEGAGTGRNNINLIIDGGITLPTDPAEAPYVYFVLPAVALNNGFAFYFYEHKDDETPAVTLDYSGIHEVVTTKNEVTTIESKNNGGAIEAKD